MANHAHRIRRKPRFRGTIMENRRYESAARYATRCARAYFARQDAGTTFLPTWDTPLDAAPQTAIQSVMDYIKKHSVPVEEYYANKRLVYDRDGFCLGMFDVADLEAAKGAPGREPMAFRDMTPEAQATTPEDAYVVSGSSKMQMIDRLKADVASGRVIFDGKGKYGAD